MRHVQTERGAETLESRTSQPIATGRRQSPMSGNQPACSCDIPVRERKQRACDGQSLSQADLLTMLYRDRTVDVIAD